MNILLVGVNSGFPRFEQALIAAGAKVCCSGSGRSADELIGDGGYAAVVVAAALADGDGLDFVQQCAKKYPLINFALESELEGDAFHEATEGLGLFMQLSADPDKEEAQQMLEILSKINGLMAS